MSAPLTVTDAHRRAAFAAFSWPGWTFEQAMAHQLRAAIVNARATQLARREHDATHAPSTVLERRVTADGRRWTTWKRPGPRTVPTLVPHLTDEETDPCRSS